MAATQINSTSTLTVKSLPAFKGLLGSGNSISMVNFSVAYPSLTSRSFRALVVNAASVSAVKIVPTGPGLLDEEGNRKPLPVNFMLNNLRKRDRYEFYLNQVKKRDGVYALGKYIPMSVDKARRVIDQIRGRSYEESLMILQLMPYRACYPILKLMYSAAANASHNKGFNKADLLITKAEVNKGTTMKKLKPQARGRSYMIKRHTCHITIVLKDMSYLQETRFCTQVCWK